MTGQFFSQADFIRVSSALEPYVDFGGASVSRVQYAAERGSDIHAICLDYMAVNLWYPHAIPVEFQGYTNSFQIFLDQMVEEVKAVELRLYDDLYQYTGKLDLIVVMKHEGLVLLDLKTPLKRARTWAAQLAAYGNLARKDSFPIPRGRLGSLQLDPGGRRPKCHWYEEEDEAFLMFINALNVQRYFEERR